jgi:drug/metabolite transporter (DMT)-like permease
VVGVGLAALLLAETIGPVQIVGGLLVLGAAILLQVASPPTGAARRNVPPPEAVPGTL